MLSNNNLETPGGSATRRRTFRVAVAGAHRGARANLTLKAALCRTSTATEFIYTYIDPSMGRSDATAGAGREIGIATVAVEGRIEDQDADLLAGQDVIILHTDRAGPIVRVLQAMRDGGPNFLAFLILQFHDSKIYTLASTVARGDERTHVSLALLADRIDANTVESHNGDVFNGKLGVGLGIEMSCRGHIGQYFTDVFSRLVAGINIERPPIAVSVGGNAMCPVVVVDRPLGFGDPVQLALRACQEDPQLLASGSFVLVEIGPNRSVRFHEVAIVNDGQELVVLKTRTAARSGVVPGPGQGASLLAGLNAAGVLRTTD